MTLKASIVRISLYCLIPVLWVISACIDEIQLDLPESNQNQLVIQGQLLSGDTTWVKVRISRTADFQAQSVPVPVEQAEVTLFNQLGDQVQLVEVEPGSYQLNMDQVLSDMPINQGDEYQLEVRLAEGAIYRSQGETLYPVPTPDSLSFVMIDREELNESGNRVVNSYMQFFLYSPLIAEGANEPSRLHWDFQGIYKLDETPPPPNVPGPGPATCYILRNLNFDQVVVHNGNESGTSRLERFALMEEKVDARFALGFLLNVRQQSLTPQGYDYWNKVAQTVALSGGLFEATPGSITGNISSESDPSEQVLGYFYVSQQKTVQLFIRPEDAGSPPEQCEMGTFDGDSELCNNCLSAIGSTLTKPQGWED
ncbi:MAG: DUF4249 domain-containing protein [Cyclobacteriaceae bacterium]|nr:DUF4249 domain-containing protein [Cyclobacteriaceae bacterium]